MNDVSSVLGLSDRQVRNLLNEWVSAGWLEVIDSSHKSRAFRLPVNYRQFIGKITAVSICLFNHLVQCRAVFIRRVSTPWMPDYFSKETLCKPNP